MAMLTHVVSAGSARLFAAVLVFASSEASFAKAASGQTEWRDTHCYYSDEPGRTLSFSLPGAHRLHLLRSNDPNDVDGGECVVSVRDSIGAEVWHATGFGAGLEPWTGHDVDGDGLPDAVITVDTGGGNRCCWEVHVLRMTPDSVRVDTLDVSTSFVEDVEARTMLWDVVPFYGLGPDMADSPVVRLARQYRGGHLVEVTAEKCPGMLDDTARDFSSLRSEWDAATPELRAAARTGADTAFAVQRTRLAVTSLALQHLACGAAQAGHHLVSDTWPPNEVAARWDTLVAAWAKVAGHYRRGDAG